MFGVFTAIEFRHWSSGSRYCVVWYVVINVSGEPSVLIFRVEVHILRFEITGFLDFVHRPVNTTFWKLDLFPSSGVSITTAPHLRTETDPVPKRNVL
jgi:hypothetical protein